ncbi:MAG TPA: chlorite dismutase family protein [Dehalococcoidia bacterium]|nr:chlorite dismutase family protein [Dehalococcoidia bacterium]
MQTRSQRPADTEAPPALCVQFAFFAVDRQWRQLPEEERHQARCAFAEAVRSDSPAVETVGYSTLGLRPEAAFFLYRTASAVEPLQESLSHLLCTKLGGHLELRDVLFGLVRPSVYARRPTPQEQAIGSGASAKYLVVYPFTKTTEWYLLSQETRQGMMNEHIRIGRSYPSIRQLLAYSAGLADQEFIVAYETDRLDEFQDLVTALRATEARRYTLRDTPIFTGVHRSLEETLALLG